MKKRRSFNNRVNLPPSPIFNAINSTLHIHSAYPTKEDLICCLMGRVGFSARNISRTTGFNVRKVYHTLYKARIRLYDFRDGKSKWGKMITNGCVDRVDREFKLLL